MVSHNISIPITSISQCNYRVSTNTCHSLSPSPLPLPCTILIEMPEYLETHVRVLNGISKQHIRYYVFTHRYTFTHMVGDVGGSLWGGVRDINSHWANL